MNHDILWHFINKIFFLSSSMVFCILCNFLPSYDQLVTLIFTIISLLRKCECLCVVIRNGLLMGSLTNALSFTFYWLEKQDKTILDILLLLFLKPYFVRTLKSCELHTYIQSPASQEDYDLKSCLIML